MNAAEYTRIINSQVDEDCIYILHDNATPHIAALTQETLDFSGLQSLHQPPHSPDLQPAENLLALLSNEVYKGGRTYMDTEGLQAAIEKAWENMREGNTLKGWDGRKLFSALAGSMPGRLLECMEKGGDWIKIRPI